MLDLSSLLFIFFYVLPLCLLLCTNFLSVKTVLAINRILILVSLWGKNNSLEFFGTFRLPYVITLQRQLTAHDLNKVLRKQPCERRANVNKLKIMTFKLLV